MNMELSFKTFILFGGVILTGLSAGLFYAWSVSVIPGTKNVTDSVYLQTMQSINRAILNPAFFMSFFGSVLFLGLASLYQFQMNSLAFWLMLAATIVYLLGTFGVTAFGNVPLNDQLDVMDLVHTGQNQMAEFRSFYEENWNRLHQIRTVFAVLAFALSILSIMTSLK